MQIVYTREGDVVDTVDTSWCREVVTEKIHNVTIEHRRKVKRFSVYGIIDGEGNYRPSPINPISDHDPMIGTVVTSLFHTTLDLASNIFSDTTDTDLLQQWQRSWCHLSTPQPALPCTIDVDDPVGVGCGSITNIPAWVGKSAPLTSFLLYLPRVWYNLASLHHWRAQGDLQKIFHTQGSALLGIIASYLAIPLYRMHYGGSAFWSFLDFLIAAASEPSYKSEARYLLTNIRCSGYTSWLGNLDETSNHLEPWCRRVISRHKIYCEYGACALVRMRVTCKL